MPFQQSALAGLLCAAAAIPALAGSLHDFRSNNPDLLPARTRALPGLVTPFGISNAQVGDADSFGRNVIYLGVVQSGQVILEEDCSADLASLGPDDRCLEVNPQPATTSFDYQDLGRAILPGGSTKDLICFSGTAFRSWTFQNETAATAGSHVHFVADITLESPALQDPSLINPVTGLPFDGKIDTGAGISMFDAQTMAAGDARSHSENVTRNCLAGVISARVLHDSYGLSGPVIKAFFNKPITIRVNLKGNASLMTLGTFMYGVRFYGD
ncbi:MAG TPA: hypothetical protein VF217_00095 [Rhodanobacteraceae bacterium]